MRRSHAPCLSHHTAPRSNPQERLKEVEGRALAEAEADRPKFEMLLAEKNEQVGPRPRLRHIV